MKASKWGGKHPWQGRQFQRKTTMTEEELQEQAQRRQREDDLRKSRRFKRIPE